MLVNTFGKKISASGTVKNSEYYIDIAKFVEAYQMILASPNEFLVFINEKPLENEEDKLTWELLSKIMLNCDFGFGRQLSDDELKTMYCYAIQIGSISKKETVLATTNEIAEAQSNYYNYIEKIAVDAENEYEKQHNITKIREKDANEVNVKLINFSIQRWVAFSLMILSVIMFCLGVAGIFISNPLVGLFENLFNFDGGRYLSAAIVMILSILLFVLFDKWNLKSKRNHFNLNYASQIIFNKFDSNYATEQVLKRKFEVLKNKFAIAKNELEDKNKRFDVLENIKALIKSNELYKKFYKGNINKEQVENKIENSDVKDELTNENENKNEIILEGQFDEQAYKEKFEKSRISKAQVKNDSSNNKKEESKEKEKIEKKKENEKNSENLKKQQEKQTENQAKEEQKRQIEKLQKEELEQISAKDKEQQGSLQKKSKINSKTSESLREK